jgi:hypothetical protein
MSICPDIAIRHEPGMDDGIAIANVSVNENEKGRGREELSLAPSRVFLPHMATQGQGEVQIPFLSSLKLARVRKEVVGREEGVVIRISLRMSSRWKGILDSIGLPLLALGAVCREERVGVLIPRPVDIRLRVLEAGRESGWATDGDRLLCRSLDSALSMPDTSSLFGYEHRALASRSNDLVY